MQKNFSYRDDVIEVDFSATLEKQDYGVRGSPTWLEIIPGTVSVTALTILGVSVEIEKLPEDLQAAILSLADEVDIE